MSGTARTTHPLIEEINAGTATPARRVLRLVMGDAETEDLRRRRTREPVLTDLRVGIDPFFEKKSGTLETLFPTTTTITPGTGSLALAGAAPTFTVGIPFNTKSGTSQTTARSYFARAIERLFRDAEDFRFEDGIQTPFSRGLRSLIYSYGNAAVAALDEVLAERRTNQESAAEAVRRLGAVDHDATHKYRSWLLQRALQSSSPLIRDAAGVGLAALDDPDAIPALEIAITNEPIQGLREDLQAVRDQLLRSPRCHFS